ncbi:MAG: hypothetical protein ACE5HX_17425 [bacterium]
MYYTTGLKKSQIAEQLGVSRPFVNRWSKDEVMDFSKDQRGWPKGKRRKWDQTTENRIKKIHRELKENSVEFFFGASAVRQEWIRRFGQEGVPALRTIGQIMKELELTQTPRKGKAKGASRYLCYPEHSIHHLMGKRVLELDFIGKKFIEARSAPLNFIAFSFKQEPKLRYFQRINAERGSEIIRCSQAFFERFEKPDALKMDNGFAMAGTAPQPGTLSQVPLWFLSQRITPIYAVPRKPFSQASIEGNNSVFSRKFWNKYNFESPEEIDELLPAFNDASVRYLGYHKPTKSWDSADFVPRVFFLRQIQPIDDKAAITLANQVFYLPFEYIHYFIFAEWNLVTEKLTVFLEKELKPVAIETFLFPLNDVTKQKLIKNKIL